MSVPCSTENILGYNVNNAPLQTCLDALYSWIDDGDYCRVLACFNPHSYVLLKENERFVAALRDVDWLMADGVGVVYASGFLGGKIRQRITGYDVFQGLHDLLERSGHRRVFFLGSTDETLHIIREKMAVQYPHIEIAGIYSPPFKTRFSPDDTAQMVDAVNVAQPDVLWVGMTAPKQDIWLYENREKLDVKIAAGVGAVFDFYAGTIQRSHPVFQRVGLEWLPRLLQEPRRLWKRMFVSAPIFVADVIREKMKGRGE